MFMRKVLSVLLALMMLMGVFAHAEEKSGYISVSDPYFTDGMNEYDFTGMNLSFELSAGEAFAQLLARLITSKGQVTGAVEADNEKMYLYADGFSVPYGIAYENASELLSEIFGMQADASLLMPSVIYTLFGSGEKAGDEGLRLSDMIYETYAAIIGNAEQIKTAKTGTVATFNHESMAAYVVPFDLDEEAFEARMTAYAKELDESGAFDSISASLEERGVLLQTDAGEKIQSCVQLYETYIAPMAFSIRGNTYYGENDIFVNIALCSEGVEIIPVYFEITNTVYPVMYLNVPVQTEEGEWIFYATVESAADRMQDYVEFGFLMNGNTQAMFMYQKTPADDEKYTVYDVYAGFASGGDIIEGSIIYETDDAAFRNLIADVNVRGIQFALNYKGTITKSANSVNEAGDIALSSNIGVGAKAGIGFGIGNDNCESIISSFDGCVDAYKMNEDETEGFFSDVRNLTEKTQGILNEMPFFAELFGSAEAEG